LRLRASLLEPGRFRRHVIDQAVERREHRAAVDQRNRTRRKLSLRTHDSHRLEVAHARNRSSQRADCARIARVIRADIDRRHTRVRHVELAADLPHAEHDRAQRGDLRIGLLVGRKVVGARVRLDHDRRAAATGERADPLPDLLRDEWHQRVQQAQRHLEHLEQRAPRAALPGSARGRRLQHGLRELEVPVAELVPHELVGGLCGEVEAVGVELLPHRRNRRAEVRADPAVRDRQLRVAGETAFNGLGVHQHEPRSVPDLVAEVPVALDPAEIEADVTSHRGERGKRVAQRVRAVGRDALRKLLARCLLDRAAHLRLHEPGRALGHERLEVDAVDQVERVDDVALRLRHLLAVLVADQPGDVDLAERDVARKPETQHDHAGHPEKDDVEAGDEHRGRVERREFLCRLWPAER
jgi:hypothetical protein